MKSLSRKGLAAAILAALGWGGATVMSKHALEHVSPVTLLVLQLLASTIFLWLIILFKQMKLPRLRAIAPIALLGLLEPGLAYLLGIIALTDLGAGSATLILASEAIMIVVVSAVFFQQKPPVLFVTMSIIAFAGLMMALGLWDATREQNGAFGVSLMFLATASAAVYVVLCGRVATTLHPILAVGAQQFVALVAVILILPFEVLGTEAGVALPRTLETWIVVVASGIIQYGIAFALYIYALSKISTNLAGSFLNLIPVFGLSIAFVALGETLTLIQLAGAIITIAALTIMNLRVDDVAEDDRLSAVKPADSEIGPELRS